MPDAPRLLTAMVTPFGKDLALDLPRARELAAKLVDEGNEGLVVTGTTGESPVLTHDEKLQLWQAVVDEVGSRATVVAGTGSNATAESVALSKEAAGTGVDMIMCVAPYYNKPSQDGMYRHFTAVAEAVDLPMIVYNVPSRTSSNISADTVANLAGQVPNIVAVKEASSDMGQIANIRREAPEDFLIYSGTDSETLPMMAIGAVGVISVAGHVVGPAVKAMVDAFHAGDMSAALAHHLKLMPVFEACFVPGAPNPAPVKAALGMLGFPVGDPRLPLVPCTGPQCALIRNALEDFGLETCNG